MANFIVFSLVAVSFEPVVICSTLPLTRKITFLMAADREVGEMETDDQFFSSKDKAALNLSSFPSMVESRIHIS